MAFIRAIILILVTLPASPVWSQTPRFDFDDSIPPGSDISFVLVNPQTNQTLISHRSTQLQAPASLQKLLTALAASLYLKNDFQYETRLELKADDVIIRFSGDPSLESGNLEELFAELAKKVSLIKGNIYLNGAVFDMFERAVGVPWDILGICYSAPSSGITLDHNCAKGRLSVASDKNIAQVTMASKHFIEATANTIEINDHKTSPNTEVDCDLKLIAGQANHYQLGGCIDRNKLPVKLNFAIQDTELYAKSMIETLLKKYQISLAGKIIRDDTKKGTLLARHRSAPVSTLLKKMLQDSDNLIADNVLKTLGAQYYKEQGGFSNGVAALKQILKKQAGINLSDAVLVDGSGLSRNNRLTTVQILQVIDFIYKNPQLGLMESMPISGKTGTLRYRRSVMQAPLKGLIRAKTGSLFGTYNLAGVIETQQKKRLLFVQMLTNFHSNDKSKSNRPIMQFEEKLYGHIYKQY